MKVTCCVVGGGPAGMMLGFLLARAGVDVAVLEKHPDFFRDFRGDTIHPSTLDVMYELGLLEDFLKIPHDTVEQLGGVVGGEFIPIADFRHLPTHCKYIALMPQWDFLNFLASRAKQYASFHVMMQTDATDVIREGGRIAGVRAATPSGDVEVRADLVIAADGRSSTVRERAQLTPEQLGAPMDVLWMRISRRPDDPAQTFGRVDAGKIFISLNRTTYWQCGFVIPKGSAQALQTAGIEAFRRDVAQIAPFLADRTSELKTWDDVKLLTVAVDRLRRWYLPGLLCIGDAAHAMSPIGGVGINLAIQDAVAAGNLLAPPLKENRLTIADLAEVERRRMFPARVTQAIQVAIQNRIVSRVLAQSGSIRAPKIMRAFSIFPLLQRIPAYLIGAGVRPEHVRINARNP